jgi:hypothetical protein
MADGLGAELRMADVPGGPPLAELWTHDGQLSHQGREPGVRGVVGGLSARGAFVRATASQS